MQTENRYRLHGWQGVLLSSQHPYNNYFKAESCEVLLTGDLKAIENFKPTWKVVKAT